MASPTSKTAKESARNVPARNTGRFRLGLPARLLLLVTVPVFAVVAGTTLATGLFLTQALSSLDSPNVAAEPGRLAIVQNLQWTAAAIIGVAVVGALLALVTAGIWFRRINEPIDEIKLAAERISNGDLNTPVPPVGEEWSDLAQTLERTRVYLRTMLSDMARRARTEAQLSAESRHNEELSILLALSQLLLARSDENSLLDLVVKTAAELLGAPLSTVVLTDSRTGDLITVAAHGWPRSVVGERVGRGPESQTGYTLLQGRPIVVDNYGQPQPFKSSPGANVASGLSVPISHEGHRVGALLVYSSAPRRFGPEDIRLLTLVANQAGAAIERARLYAQSIVQTNELRTLAQISEALNRAETADTTLRLVLTEALKLVNDEQGCIILVEPDGSTLRLYTWLGIPERSVEQFNDRHFQKYHGIFANSIMRGEFTEVSTGVDTQTADDYADTLLAQKVNVPLKTDGKTIGVISLNGLPVNEQARRMLLALADLAATAIAKSRLYERTQVLAVTDELTGLFNRRGFFDLGQREFERARRFGRPVAAILIDVDHFKAVNDDYGHAAGNVVLADMASLCRAEIRDVDLLGRYGGEEFVLLLPETTEIGGDQAAERLRGAVAGHRFQSGRGELQLTISLGLAILADSDQTLAELIDRADQALYQAKRSGRNRVERWAAELSP